MAEPISAIEHHPHEYIREVSPDAIAFYVDELSGMYLPEDFRQAHVDAFDVEFWGPEKRLYGKFGRFAVRSEEGSEHEDILLMGTTIGMGSLDRGGHLESLRHYHFKDMAEDLALNARDLDPETWWLEAVDYGGTTISLDALGKPRKFRISGNSIDFGRANAEGREKTCELAATLLSGTVEVVNSDPEPREHEQIIRIRG